MLPSYRLEVVEEYFVLTTDRWVSADLMSRLAAMPEIETITTLEDDEVVRTKMTLASELEPASLHNQLLVAISDYFAEEQCYLLTVILPPISWAAWVPILESLEDRYGASDIEGLGGVAQVWVYTTRPANDELTQLFKQLAQFELELTISTPPGHWVVTTPA